MTTQLAPSKVGNTLEDGWPVKVDMKVIVPGLVRYSDLKDVEGNEVTGEIYVDKEFLDRIASTLESRPIINWDHRDVDPKEFSKGKFQGIITGPAVFNAADGWYHAPGAVWDTPTLKNIQNGYAISCAYTISEWGDGPGTLNQVPYLNKPVNGSYTHIAVVPVPRYEGASIELLNSVQGGPSMGVLNLFRKDNSKESIEIDLDKTTTLKNGKTVSVSDMLKAFEAKNAASEELSDDSYVVHNGKKVTIAQLKNAMEEKENADESVKMDNAHNNKEHDTVPVINCVKCNAVEEEKKNAAKEDEEKKNAEDKKKDEEAKNAAAEEEKKKDDEKKNSMKAEADEAKKRALALDQRRNAGGKVEMPTVTNLQSQVLEGQKRYGSLPVAK